MNNNNPPFAIGEEVVCVDDRVRCVSEYPVSKYLKNGTHYNVIGLKKQCCTWGVDIGVRLEDDGYGITACGFCGSRKLENGSVYYFAASRFRRLHRYPSLSKELAEQAMDYVQTEEVEVIKEHQKEKV